MSPDEMPDDELKKLESEVGELLDQAEQLSDQLAEEVGSDQGSDPVATAPPSPDQPAIAPAVDAQLDAADTALDDATRELGSEPAPAAERSKRISLPPKRKTPPSTAAARPNPTEQPSATASNSGNTILLPSKRNASENSDGADQLVAGQVENTPFDLHQTANNAQRLRSMMSTQRVGRACADSADVAAKALEWIDRPFHFVGYRARTLIGWVALALMTATVALYVFMVR